MSGLSFGILWLNIVMIKCDAMANKRFRITHKQNSTMLPELSSFVGTNLTE